MLIKLSLHLFIAGVFIYLLIVARRAVDELDDEDSLPIDGRSRSSSNLEGHSGHEGIPEGRTSMAEYRPLSAGLTHVSVVRPSFDNTSASRKSLNMDGMVQRQVFERQNTTTFNTIARRSHSIDLPPSYDGKWRMTRESNEGNKLLGGSDDGDVDEVESANSSIVNRLESIAYDRSQKYAE